MSYKSKYRYFENVGSGSETKYIIVEIATGKCVRVYPDNSLLQTDLSLEFLEGCCKYFLYRKIIRVPTSTLNAAKKFFRS